MYIQLVQAMHFWANVWFLYVHFKKSVLECVSCYCVDVAFVAMVNSSYSYLVKASQFKASVHFLPPCFSVKCISHFYTFLHEMASSPEDGSSCFAWKSTNPCFSNTCLDSVTVLSLPSVVTSMLRDCKRAPLGPVLSSFNNLSAIRRLPLIVTKHN